MGNRVATEETKCCSDNWKSAVGSSAFTYSPFVAIFHDLDVLDARPLRWKNPIKVEVDSYESSFDRLN